MWDWLCTAYRWLYHWQTLVGAVLALIAAVWTIVVMNRQSRAETLRHINAEKRKRLAARSHMPDALSEMTRYVQGCAQRLNGETATLPEPPVAAIDALKSVIEFIDDDAAARTFELVSWYQVQRARLTSDPVPSHPKIEYSDRLYDAVLLQAYVHSLFDYARNRSQEVSLRKPTRSEMVEGLKNAVGLAHYATHEEHYKEVYKRVERLHPEE